MVFSVHDIVRINISVFIYVSIYHKIIYKYAENGPQMDPWDRTNARSEAVQDMGKQTAWILLRTII